MNYKEAGYENVSVVTYCKSTGKVMYSRSEAGAVINTAHRGGGSHYSKRSGHLPRRCYLCPHCNKYHVTSMTEREYRESIS